MSSAISEKRMISLIIPSLLSGAGVGGVFVGEVVVSGSGCCDDVMCSIKIK